MEQTYTCLAIGFFDAFHLGHAHIIETVLEKSKEHNYKAKVITLYDEKALVYSSEAEKKYHIEKKGITSVESLPCTNDLNIGSIIQKENAKLLVVGEKVELLGLNTADLEKIAHPLGCEVLVCKTVCYNNLPITMERIKDAIKKNNLETYTKLCGHPYTMIGEIVMGKQIGRTVGMPTANLSFEKNKILPELGVYSTVSHFGNERFMGMTNIGLRPTVDEEKRITVETFIIDFDKMVYGETCVLEVHFFTRGVQKFNSLQEVQQQVAKDVEVSKMRLSEIFKSGKMG